MATLTRRTQLLLDEDRYRRLSERAEDSGASVAELIRKAIDEVYPAVSDSRRRAAERFLAAEPADVELGDWPEVKKEIETMYLRALPEEKSR